ncbi:FKBP-type peptidyl-prolyl cis-trans isomerase [Niabella drilacis]|uniref:peptidylprolyl isomerase n=1 Tax=Niabella drilacis (strain DSM 25811 / CCM 8410 / CCUG 62505 / LMG 26954 / E90) TaxID=1285928 RepID=A0A1G6YGH8_NIADE|nr:FKBP-type peptidyl-prolyl cis-trans isomerase [Niabella drilacis]SDD88725.1 FKBP-type peptidyl-prolyl cis-trans isomerase [Niabella drilacis]
MKRFRSAGLFLFTAMAFTACNNTDFKTSPSGLQYKIFSGAGKDSAVDGNVLKLNMIVRLSGHKDTVLANTYGKLPFFTAVRALPPGQSVYDPSELFHGLKKGDSLVVLIHIDSAIKKGILPEAQLPPYLKKGDRITYTYKVLELFKSDSIARADYQKEMVKDAPRQQKEQEEMMAKMKKEMEAKQKVEDAELEKSGEKAKQTAEVEEYLKKKGINAAKTPIGAFVKLDNPGTGAPVADGKYVTVKYTGKKVLNDSTFEGPSSFTTKIGVGGAIRGFEDGLKQFRQGGTGAVYIPGYLAYGKTPPQGAPFKEYEPLYFEVEIASVSDSMPAPQMPPPAPQPPAKKEPKK